MAPTPTFTCQGATKKDDKSAHQTLSFASQLSNRAVASTMLVERLVKNPYKAAQFTVTTLSLPAQTTVSGIVGRVDDKRHSFAVMTYLSSGTSAEYPKIGLLKKEDLKQPPQWTYQTKDLPWCIPNDATLTCADNNELCISWPNNVLSHEIPQWDTYRIPSLASNQGAAFVWNVTIPPQSAYQSPLQLIPCVTCPATVQPHSKIIILLPEGGAVSVRCIKHAVNAYAWTHDGHYGAAATYDTNKNPILQIYNQRDFLDAPLRDASLNTGAPSSSSSNSTLSSSSSSSASTKHTAPIKK